MKKIAILATALFPLSSMAVPQDAPPPPPPHAEDHSGPDAHAMVFEHHPSILEVVRITPKSKTSISDIVGKNGSIAVKISDNAYLTSMLGHMLFKREDIKDISIEHARVPKAGASELFTLSSPHSLDEFKQGIKPSDPGKDVASVFVSTKQTNTDDDGALFDIALAGTAHIDNNTLSYPIEGKGIEAKITPETNLVIENNNEFYIVGYAHPPMFRHGPEIKPEKK